MKPFKPRALLGLAVAVLAAATGCEESSVLATDSTFPEAGRFCNIPQNLIFSSAAKDGIPALTNPLLVTAGEAGTEYLKDETRVIGLFDDGQPIAIPLNIMWFHEVVNLEMNGIPVSITHCPLTGSTMGFKRQGVNGAEFGVSGLLFQNNLIMYDRNSPESLWPQMAREASCGDRTGASLDMVSVFEMSWGGWRSMHPNTRVVSADTGWPRPYSVYPYGDYDTPENPMVLYPQELDSRFPPKERVLGIPHGSGGMVFPFESLRAVGPLTASHAQVGGGPVVVFWDSSVESAMAYSPSLEGQELRFAVQGDAIVDAQTGTSWRVDGLALEGPLAGSRLQPISEAFVAYWFAWPAFYPAIEIWSGS